VFRYFHGLFAILIYVAFYVSIFGLEEVKWMFINGGLGILGTYAQIDWILSLFGKDIRSYSMIRHLIPSLYLILYTFLLYNALLDFSGARENPEKKRRVEIFYVLGSALLYGGYYFYSGFGVKS
jgi:uncharacterized membrane-anchored protein